MKKILNLLLLGAVTTSVFAAEMPEGYYDAANGKHDAELKGTLKAIIREHTVIPYGEGKGKTWEVFYYSDRDTETGLCMDMYCDDWKPLNNPGDKAAGCNIEHSFAKSWWGGGEVDAYKDCYHLNPSNSNANSARGNFPLGNVTNPTKTAGSLKIGKRYHKELGVEHYIWEPKDEYKGDFARAYFYMATCYGRDINGKPDSQFSQYKGWRLDNPDVGSRFAMQNDTYLEFQDWEIEVLLAWHRQDPVSIKEINRADAVNDFQHNRNPFIDYPCLAEYIWGNRKGENVDFSSLKFTRDDDYLSLPEEDKCGCSNQITKPTITSPRNNSTIDFGTLSVGESTSKAILVKAGLVTKPVTISITGSNADQFELPTTSLTAEQLLAGTTIYVTFNPKKMGKANAVLTFASSELKQNTQVNLTAECGFHALPATGIMQDGFTANWTDAGVDEYTLDVYQITKQGGAVVEVVNASDLSQSSIKEHSNLEYSGNTVDESEGIRLGTSKNTGTLKIVKVDLTQGGKLVVKAQSYSNDGSSMKIKADKFEKTVTLTSNFADYEFDIPSTNATEIEIAQTANKKRIIVSSVKLLAGGTTEVKNSLEGYPKTVTGVSYEVKTTLTEDSKFYYVVTPKGGTPSNVIAVSLSGSSETAVENTETHDMRLFSTPEGIALEGIPAGSTLRLFDISGRLLQIRQNCSENEQFSVNRGIYLLNIDGKKTVKIVR